MFRPALVVERPAAGESGQEVEEIQLVVVGIGVLLFHTDKSLSYHIYTLNAIQYATRFRVTCLGHFSAYHEAVRFLYEMGVHYRLLA